MQDCSWRILRWLVLSQSVCDEADRGSLEKTNASVSLEGNTVYLKSTFSTMDRKNAGNEGGYDLVVMCKFSYSMDGMTYRSLGIRSE